jgi:hypothetical protein
MRLGTDVLRNEADEWGGCYSRTSVRPLPLPALAAGECRCRVLLAKRSHAFNGVHSHNI